MTDAHQPAGPPDLTTVPPPPMAQASTPVDDGTRMALRILALLLLVVSAATVLNAAWQALMYVQHTRAASPHIVVAVQTFALVERAITGLIALLGVLAGAALLRRAEWARRLAIVVAVLVPVATLAGYAIGYGYVLSAPGGMLHTRVLLNIGASTLLSQLDSIAIGAILVVFLTRPAIKEACRRAVKSV